MDYTLKDYTEQDIPRITELFQTLYHEQRAFIGSLPPYEAFSDFLKTSYTERFGKHAFGKTLWHKDEMVGFVIGIEIKNFWGTADGFLTPIHGHGVLKEHRVKGYRTLYRALAEELVKKGLTSHAITLYAEDNALVDAWFHLGFGLRCMDAIKPIEGGHPSRDDLSIRKLDSKTVDAFAPMEKAFHSMFRRPPIFMPEEDEDAEAHLRDFLSGKGHVLYGAYKDGVPVGMINARPTGDNVITTSEAMMNITGLYVPPEFRGQGIAKALLDHLENALSKDGCTILGTDFESFNTEGSTFWHRHFTPYTYSLHRRIDERIIPFYKAE